MNLGLGNLSDVRTFVLPPELNVPGDTQYDSVLGTIAAGIAERFGLYTNRSARGTSCLGYLANDQALFDAHRTHYWLPRYPVTSLAKLEMCSTVDGAWSDVTSAIIQQDLSIGFLDFGAYLGDRILQLRCTYTGGYWFETLEPTDANGVATVGYPSAVPSGAALLPASLKSAWLTQVLHEFQLKDRLLPESITGDKGSHKGAAWRLDQMQLLPEVQNVLNQFRRMQVVA